MMDLNLDESRISELKKMRDEVPLTSEDRGLFDAGLTVIEKHWADRQQSAYDDAMERHTTQHEQVWKTANDSTVAIKELTSYLLRGRGDVKKAAVLLRDKHAEHGRLYDQHEALLAAQEEIDRQYTLSPADYQAQAAMHERFPAARTSTLTIGRAISLAAREDG
jgi:hypothetical protein